MRMLDAVVISVVTIVEKMIGNFVHANGFKILEVLNLAGDVLSVGDEKIIGGKLFDDGFSAEAAFGEVVFENTRQNGGEVFSPAAVEFIRVEGGIDVNMIFRIIISGMLGDLVSKKLVLGNDKFFDKRNGTFPVGD